MGRRLLIIAVVLAGCEARIFKGSTKLGSPEPTPPTPSEPRPLPAPAPSATRIRALNATEYRNTIRDLLGLPVAQTLSHYDWTVGFDSGGNLLVDENLFAALLDEAQRLSEQYVGAGLRAAFPCFDAAQIADACIQQVVTGLGRRAFRRPLSGAERAELLRFFSDVARQTDSRLMATQVLVARLISAPQFLYRTEVGRLSAPLGTTIELDPYERASLLSYALTGSMPDGALLDDAEAGTLDDVAFRGHLQRLWGSPANRERVLGFFRQWLKVTRLDEMATRPAAFEKLPTPELGQALKDDFDGFVGGVLFDGDRRLATLFASREHTVNAQTAGLYGLGPVTGPSRVTLPAERRGVLTLAGTMAAIGSAGDPLRDRPVLRGLMVKHQLLCEEVGAPSAVNTVAAREAAQRTPDFDRLTTREQFETIMQQGPECRACHRQFMPLGFVFGRFDALGRYRTDHLGRPINTAVADVPFAGATVAFGDAAELSQAVASHPALERCFAQNLVNYTSGASEPDRLPALLDRLLERPPKDMYSLLEGWLTSRELYVRAFNGAEDPPDAGQPTTPAAVLLSPGQRLGPGQEVKTPDQVYMLVYQGDGHLVLYRTGQAVWWSGTAGTSPGQTLMQGDGNLVVYDSSGAPRFNTQTQGNPGASLILTVEGRPAIIAADGRTLRSL